MQKRMKKNIGKRKVDFGIVVVVVGVVFVVVGTAVAVVQSLFVLFFETMWWDRERRRE